MLLLVTILLVAGGAIMLLFGAFTQTDAAIYVSILMSGLAAISLIVLSTLTKRRMRAAPAAGGPAPLDDDVAPAPAPSFSSRTPVRDEEPEDEPDLTTAADDLGFEPVTVASSGADDLEFPIEDYDDLRVNEILPLLPELELDELDLVREREEQGKARTSVLNRIDQLIDQLEAEEAAAAPAPVSTRSGAVALDALDEDDELDDEYEDEEEAEEDVEDEPTAALPSDDDGFDEEYDEQGVDEEEAPGLAAVAAAASTMAHNQAAMGTFPIADYDDLDEDEIIPLLDELEPDELEDVAEREERGKARDAVLDHIDDLLDEFDAAAEAGTPLAPRALRDAEPEPEPAPVKRAPAKKAATKKAAASPTKKAAGTAKKAPAKKAATTAKKAPAKKAAAKSTTTAKKAPAKKAAASKSTTTAKKAPAKKAAAAKKTTKKA